MYHLILASESPRRREIMDTMGITYEVMPANVIEEVEETEPERMVQALAAKKVNDIAGKLDKDKNLIIIGADTMVFSHGQALGKPKDKEDAVRMLQLLSGDIHEVCTGVAIIIRKKEEEIPLSFAVSTKVKVHTLTNTQIEDYIQTGEPMDKAGAYAIQGKFGLFINSIEGDYYNIVGLPIAHIYSKLLALGIDLKKDCAL